MTRCRDSAQNRRLHRLTSGGRLVALLLLHLLSIATAASAAASTGSAIRGAIVVTAEDIGRALPDDVVPIVSGGKKTGPVFDVPDTTALPNPTAPSGAPGSAANGSAAGAANASDAVAPPLVGGFDSIVFSGVSTILGDAVGLFDASTSTGNSSGDSFPGATKPGAAGSVGGKPGDPELGETQQVDSMRVPDDSDLTSGNTGAVAGPGTRPPPRPIDTNLNFYYPHVGEITPETAIPIDQALSEAALPTALRTEVEAFLASLTVDGLLSDARGRVSSEDQASDILAVFDGVVTLTQAARVNLGRQPSGAAWPALDKDGRVWEYVTQSVLRLAADRSRQFKDAVLILLNAYFRDGGITTNPANCPTSSSALPTCSACSPYRSADGTCNNLGHPLYGRTGSPLRRFVKPAYDDGVGSPRVTGVTGLLLPSARLVSTRVLPRTSDKSASYSHMLMQWAQFIDHDLSLSPTIAGADGIGLTCCADDLRRTFNRELPYSVQQQLSNRQGCFNIPVPANDPFFLGRKTCMGFSRSSTVPEFDCKLGVRSPINVISSYIDGSMVYGNTQADLNNLRSFSKGRLRTQELPGRRSLLPLKSGLLCNKRNASFECFAAGDGRVNEQPGLASLHVVLLREHNRVAGELRARNPSWNDEQLFQEARKIVSAEIQHITYSEFLPIVIGPALYDLYDLRPKAGADFYSGYNEEVDVSVRSEFSTVAFRFGHSLIRDLFTLTGTNRNTIGSFKLQNHYFSPDLLYSSQATDSSILRGLLRDPMENCDHKFTTQVGDRLFETGSLANTPLDLMALNIQRGRDHGIPSYAQLRKAFGMTVPTSFDDLVGTHDENVVASLKAVYADVRDVDAFVGGISERPLPGAVVGPLFGKIIAVQFALAKSGDRFFYENSCQSSFASSTCGGQCNFNAAQLVQIKRVTLSRLLCDNADIPSIQRNAFRTGQASFDCSLLPSADLSFFAAN